MTTSPTESTDTLRVCQIWLNHEPPPSHVREWMDGWREAADEYTILTADDLVGEVPEDRIASAMRLYGKGTTNYYRMCSDMLRYEWMYRHGGVYADIDMEVVGPVRDMIRSDTPVVLRGMGNKPDSYRCNGFLSFPGARHPAIGRMLNIPIPEGGRVDAITGPWAFSGAICGEAHVAMSGDEYRPYIRRHQGWRKYSRYG